MSEALFSSISRGTHTTDPNPVEGVDIINVHQKAKFDRKTMERSDFDGRLYSQVVTNRLKRLIHHPRRMRDFRIQPDQGHYYLTSFPSLESDSADGEAPRRLSVFDDFFDNFWDDFFDNFCDDFFDDFCDDFFDDFFD